MVMKFHHQLSCQQLLGIFKKQVVIFSESLTTYFLSDTLTLFILLNIKVANPIIKI